MNRHVISNTAGFWSIRRIKVILDSKGCPVSQVEHRFQCLSSPAILKFPQLLSVSMHEQYNMSAALENPFILLVDKKISNTREILPLLESIANSGRPPLVIAEDVEGLK